VPLLKLKPPEAGDVALAVELEIVQHEHPLAVEMRLVVAAHDERPVQALLQLHGLVDVGAVPERPRIRQHEPVLERLPGLDGLSVPPLTRVSPSLKMTGRSVIIR